MDGHPNRLGKLMRRWRETHELSQREIAARLGYKNVNFISMLEHGTSSVPLGRIFDVVKAYELPKEVAVVMAKTISPDAWKMITEMNTKILKHKAMDKKIQDCEEAFDELLSEMNVR